VIEVSVCVCVLYTRGYLAPAGQAESPCTLRPAHFSSHVFPTVVLTETFIGHLATTSNPTAAQNACNVGYTIIYHANDHR
jgi:hypothetical protein